MITKAFEKTGEILGEKALEQAGNLLSLLIVDEAQDWKKARRDLLQLHILHTI
ncbi:hypothetical protein [Nostoc sp. GT001]|uniref:hypothetical protein n=1 Tax=Nostoc sp. GT001 TaxID=3056647 RepID=UPI0025AAFC82|nr:hypothetical protein [Nostoc sp. GT001]MDM9586218.1 hypothetical protein [Nostoc sp. GT001]